MKKYVFADWREVEPGVSRILRGYYPMNCIPHGIRLAVHKPVIQPVLRAEHPWEGYRVGCDSYVARVGDRYYMWYACIDGGMEDIVFGAQVHLALATSTDGIHWEKPILGVCEFQGSTANNLVRACERTMDHGYSIYADPNAPEDERFQLLYTRVFYDPDRTRVVLMAMVSPDGIHWTDRGLAAEDAGDTQSIFFYDPKYQKYVLYTKACCTGYGRREIFRATADSFGPFSDRQLIMTPGAATDAPDEDWYTCPCQPWPGAEDAYVMFPSNYHRSTDKVDISLGTSRDGIRWTFPGRGVVENTDRQLSMYMGGGMIDNGDGTWSHYYAAYDDSHNSELPPCDYRGEICRATFREDGYISLRADSVGCFATERTFTLKDADIRINAKCEPSGYVKVEVVDEKTGLPLEGFSKEDCVLETVDNVWSKVSWTRPVSELPEGSYRLKFHMLAADLFAFTV